MEKINLEKSTLIIGAGIAGSGKTVILREVAKNVNDSLIIDKDSINESFLYTLGELEGIKRYKLTGQKRNPTEDYYNQNVRFQTYHCMLEIARDNIMIEKHPILDGNYTKEIRSGYIDEVLFPFFEGLDFKTKIIFCYADEDIIRKRLKERGKLRDMDKISSEKNWRRFLKEQPILPPELEAYDHIKVDSSKPLENNIPPVLDYLKQKV